MDEMTVNEYNKEFQFADSDFTLISADQVEFKIHKYKLQAASSVFQVMFDASSTTDNDRLELTDETIETAKVLSLFLRIIYGRKLEAPVHETDLNPVYRKLVYFVVKYDALAAREYLCLGFRLWTTTDTSSAHNYFSLAPLLNCPEIAIAALKNDRKHTWHGSPSQDVVDKRKALLESCIKGDNTLNLAAWCYNDFKKIPHEYIFAWLRARETTWGVSKPTTNYKAVGEEYEKIIGYLTSDGKA